MTINFPEQVICDDKGRFLSVNSSKPGSSHDSTIFKDSEIGKSLKNGEFGDGYLLGDDGYSNTPFFLTPYSNPQNRAEVTIGCASFISLNNCYFFRCYFYQERFNVAHKCTRSIVERSFGMAKKRFHCLFGELRMKPDRCCQYYYLHKFIL